MSYYTTIFQAVDIYVNVFLVFLYYDTITTT